LTVKGTTLGFTSCSYAAPALPVISQLKVRIVSGGYHVVGATSLSVQRTGERLEKVVKLNEGDTEDILLWPQNETSDTLSGTALLCRFIQTLTCTFQTFTFLAYCASKIAKKARVTSNTVHTNLIY